MSIVITSKCCRRIKRGRIVGSKGEFCILGALCRWRWRWECAAIGELYQHDSSPHQGWPGAQKQTLILTADDHSRPILAGRFNEDSTWSHFCVVRPGFEKRGPPASSSTLVFSRGLKSEPASALYSSAQSVVSLT